MNIFNFTEIAGYLGGILTLIACGTYIWAITKGKVQSNKVTWGIWSLVTLMICVGYYMSTGGFVDSIWVSIAYFFGTLGTFIALLFYVKEAEWSWAEKVSLVGVAVTLILWIAYHSSILGLTLTLIIDMFGAFLIIKGAYQHPDSEHVGSWYIGFAANAVNLFAIEQWDYSNATYPVYLFCLTGIMVMLIAFPKFLRRY